MLLPCIAGECAADNARKRLASGVALCDIERADLEVDAAGCMGPQADPFDRSLTWDECPAKAAHKRSDIEGALMLRGLASMAPLQDWPRGYTARVVEAWVAIEAARS